MIGQDAEHVALDYGFFAFRAICGFGIGHFVAIAYVHVVESGLPGDGLGFDKNILGRGRQMGQFVLRHEPGKMQGIIRSDVRQ